jgi:hypothetical protein
MAIVDADVREAVQTLVRDLVAERYDKLVSDGRAGRLTSEELARAIRQYGRTPRELPEEAWDVVDVYPRGKGFQSVDVPLWTEEEGRSDLTLSLSVERSDDSVQVSIEDLHVL